MGVCSSKQENDTNNTNTPQQNAQHRPRTGQPVAGSTNSRRATPQSKAKDENYTSIKETRQISKKHNNSVQKKAKIRDISNLGDQQLQNMDADPNNKEIKVLLLGAGESGKSTILQQLKIIHGGGYSKDELLEFVPLIYNNILELGNDLINAREKLFIKVEPNDSEFSKKDIEEFKNFALETDDAESSNDNENDTDADKDRKDLPIKKGNAASAVSPKQKTRTIQTFPPEIRDILKKLWNLRSSQKLINSPERSSFYLMDSAKYFMDNIDRITEKDYVPTLQDILRSRQKTTGIFDTHISLGSNSNLHLFDVGGQRSERKKWIHCFDNVTLIIYCISLSEYDQSLLEDDGQNRFHESLVLFENILNSRWFARTSVVLFLNKIDLFAEKIKKVPLENYFPDYTGGQDINKATKYILWRYMQLNRANLNIYPHVTQATDTSNIKLVFAAIKETVLENSLKDSGVL